MIIHKLISFFVALSMVLTPISPTQPTQSVPDLVTTQSVVAQPEKVEPGAGVLFRTRITVDQPTDWARLAEMDVVILNQGETDAMVLADFDQLANLTRLEFQPTGTDEFSALVAANGAERPWLAKAVGPVLERSKTMQTQVAQRSLGPVGADEAETVQALATLRTVVQTLTPEVQAALADSFSLDDDGDGLTNTEESWWCTDPLNADSNGDGKSDGDTVRALRNPSLSRQERHIYGPPYRLWPPFVATISPGATPTCLLDADKDSIPDLVEQYVVGTSSRDESTDGDKFDDGQEFFGITFCPGGSNFCDYGQYPRAIDSSFISERLPTWIRPPGDSPFVAAYPVIEFSVAPETIRVVTKEIKTFEKTITQGEEISTGFAETKGNSTTVGTIDTNTRSGWQEHSSSVGGIEPATVLGDTSPNSLDSMSAFDSFNWVVEPTPAANNMPIIATLSVSRTIHFVEGVVEVSKDIENALNAAVSVIPEDTTRSDTFAVSALSDFGKWKLATILVS